MTMFRNFCYVLSIAIAVGIGARSVTHEVIHADWDQVGALSPPCDQKLDTVTCPVHECHTYKKCIDSETDKNVKDCSNLSGANSTKQCYDAAQPNCTVSTYLKDALLYSTNCE
jgi:hypothetical protein